MNELRKKNDETVAVRIIKSVILGVVALTVTYFFFEKYSNNPSNILKTLSGIIFIILATIMVIAVFIAIVSGLYELLHPLPSG